MPRPKKPVEGVTVKVANAVHDGKGGFFAVGTVIQPHDEAALKAKGLVE